MAWLPQQLWDLGLKPGKWACVCVGSECGRWCVSLVGGCDMCLCGVHVSVCKEVVSGCVSG